MTRSLAFLVLCCCATSAPKADAVEVEDEDLTKVASSALLAQLQANGVSTDLFDLETRLEAEPGGGLKLQVVCSTRADHILKAQVQVKGHGASRRRLIPSMVSKAAKDLAVDCR